MEDIRVVKTKEALFDALLLLLKNNNFDNITVSQLCKAARINRTTFYAHFKNIDELFQEHFEKILNELRLSYVDINKKLQVPELDSMVPLFEHILKYRKIYDVLLSEHAPLTYTLRFQNAIAQFPSEVIKQHVEENIDLDLYYSFCIGATFGMIRHWKNTDYKLTPEEMGVYITKFFQY